MEYGPQTKQLLGIIASGELFKQANLWTPDRFTLPFPERLAAVIGDFYDVPSSPAERNAAIRKIVAEGSAEHGFTFSRTTLKKWMDGGRDPSVSSSDSQTRENIYRLCAALDFDLELSAELFEKVFFSRAFNPKNLQELCYFFHAKKDFESGLADGSWYRKGKELFLLVSGTPGNEDSALITDTSFLVNRTEYLSEQEFIRFVAHYHATFQPSNWNETARKMICDYTIRCSNVSGRFGKVTDLRQVAWDTLISDIIGYSQRSTASVVGAVSGISSLPAQLTTNFPSGPILRKICSHEESSFDRMYKMLCLLLFYQYFSTCTGHRADDRSFQTFLRFANHELQRASFPELYPAQPFSGMLLFCASHEDPVQALQRFIRSSIEKESEAVLLRELSESLPDTDGNTLKRLLRLVGYDSFNVGLIAATLRDPACTLTAEKLVSSIPPQEERSFAMERARRVLLELVGFPERERQILRAAAVFPPDGISDPLFRLLFSPDEQKTAGKLVHNGWLICEKGSWKADHRIRELVFDQEWFPRAGNCRGLIGRTLSILPDIPVQGKGACAQLSAFVRRLASLDGLEEEIRSELFLKTAERIRPTDPQAADRLLSRRKKASA